MRLIASKRANLEVSPDPLLIRKSCPSCRFAIRPRSMAYPDSTPTLNSFSHDCKIFPSLLPPLPGLIRKQVAQRSFTRQHAGCSIHLVATCTEISRGLLDYGSIRRLVGAAGAPRNCPPMARVVLSASEYSSGFIASWGQISINEGLKLSETSSDACKTQRGSQVEPQGPSGPPPCLQPVVGPSVALDTICNPPCPGVGPSGLV